MPALMDVLQAQVFADVLEMGRRGEKTSEFHLGVAKEGTSLNCLLATIIRQSAKSAKVSVRGLIFSLSPGAP